MQQHILTLLESQEPTTRNYLKNRTCLYAARCAAAVFLALTLPGRADAQLFPLPPTIIYNEFHKGCLNQTGGGRIGTLNCGIWQWKLEPVPGGPADRKFITAYNLSGFCLEAGDEHVLIRNCNNGEWQQWIIHPNEARPPATWAKGIRIRSVRNQNVCIDNYKSDKVRLWECGNSYQQQWNISKDAFDRLKDTIPNELHMGMTWSTIQNLSSTVHVGMHGMTNQFQGDTRARESHPILCIRADFMHPAPPEVPWPPDPNDNHWSGGYVNITAPIQGNSLTSRAAADSFCSSAFGSPWRMAEWHDGGSVSLWAYGNLPMGQRFWVAINDQPANPWN